MARLPSSLLPTTPYFCSSPPCSIVEPIMLKPANSFLRADELALFFHTSLLLTCSPPPTLPPCPRARHGFYRGASESLHTKICTNTISHDPLSFSLFFGPDGFATVNEQMYYPPRCRCWWDPHCPSLCSTSNDLLSSWPVLCMQCLRTSHMYLLLLTSTSA